MARHFGRNTGYLTSPRFVAGAFCLSHSFMALCDSNSATSMLSIVGPFSPTCRISSV
jgi:hypothetical protein